MRSFLIKNIEVTIELKHFYFIEKFTRLCDHGDIFWHWERSHELDACVLCDEVVIDRGVWSQHKYRILVSFLHVQVFQNAEIFIKVLLFDKWGLDIGGIGLTGTSQTQIIIFGVVGTVIFEKFPLNVYIDIDLIVDLLKQNRNCGLSFSKSMDGSNIFLGDMWLRHLVGHIIPFVSFLADDYHRYGEEQISESDRFRHALTILFEKITDILIIK